MLQIKNFKKTYKNKEISIPNIIIKEKVTMLVGGNGSGKSTLIKAILDFICYEGEINNPFTISYMPEHTYFPTDITVEVFLKELSHNIKTEYDYRYLCSLFNLTEKLDSIIKSLSKGMKSKLNLIQSLLPDKDLYILDEPLNGLDKETVKKLSDFIKRSDKKFLVTSHIPNSFSNIKKEVISLD